MNSVTKFQKPGFHNAMQIIEIMRSRHLDYNYEQDVIDPATFVETKFISISLSKLIKLFLDLRFASFLLLLLVSQHHAFI